MKSERLITILLFFVNVIQLSGAEKYNLASYAHIRYTETQETDDFWSVRRWALYGKTQLTKQIKFAARCVYKANNDLTHKTDDRIYLQHAFFTIKFSPHLNLKAGQFKPPFGWERFQPDYRIPTAERSQVIDRLIPAGAMPGAFARDYGIQLSGKMTSIPLFYEFAVMEGNGANMGFSFKNAPLLVSRLAWKSTVYLPVISKPMSFTMQFAYAWRNNKKINLSRQFPGCNKSFFSKFSGIDHRFNVVFHSKIGKLSLVGEYIKTKLLPDTNHYQKLFADGWYMQFDYFMFTKWQFCLKYELFNPNTEIINKHDVQWFTTGLNYYFNHPDGRIMLNYVHKMEKQFPVKNNIIVIQLQYFLFSR